MVTSVVQASDTHLSQSTPTGQLYVMMSPQEVLTGANQRSIAPRTQPYNAKSEVPRTSRDDKRRAQHNEVERRRRDKINNWIVTLSKTIPDCNIDPTKSGQVSISNESKGGILSKACDYIQELRQNNLRLGDDLSTLDRLKMDNQLLRQENDATGLYGQLTGVPKALLPGIGGKKILDFWWETVNTRQLFSEVYLVTNADKYKHYERWATANDFPVENVVNDGSTTLEGRLGAVADLELAIRSRKLQDDIMVIAGDMLCADQNFDIAQVLRFFRSKPGELAIYYELEEGEKSSSRGIVEVCPETHRISRFLEKPQEGVTALRLASVVFYCLRKATLPYLSDFLTLQPQAQDRTFGRFWEWIINEEKLPVFGMKLPTGFQLIGQVGLSDYTKWLAHYSAQQQQCPAKPITCRSYARVGLMGNPSDGFNGKTIAMTISNFWAEVTLMESQALVLLPHPLNDPTEFGSLQDLYCISRKEGYLGGLRLLQATCKKFYQFCSKQGIALTKQNFTLKYDTNIPRQVGLAGSSAIVSATLKCLMKFYNITESDLPKPTRANFILNVETDELFITAGLQDRVVQVYEGLVYMDFSKQLMDEQGYGDYIPMDMSSLPPFWLAYLSDPSDSGRIHSNVRQRWLNGEAEVIDAMKSFAGLTDQARVALQGMDWSRLAQLMDENFALRRSVYTEDCLGPGNLKMVQLARQFGSAAKLPGSGGAVVGLCLDQVRLVRLVLSLLKQQCILYALWNHWKRDCVSYFGHFILIVAYKWLIDAQAINCNSVI
uniref:Glucuronokinase with putative uridyl pyrophosphorylase n=1 Tax=Oncorhynchus kisutch TaxID=8019 RepID=A0A8C7KE49_ONCKI